MSVLVCSCERPTEPVHDNPYDLNYEYGDPILSTPTNLLIRHISPREVKVKWQDNSTFEDGFMIQRAVSDGGFTEIDSVDSNVTSYNDTTLDTTLRYQYRVYAFKGGRTSPFSERQAINHKFIGQRIVALSNHSDAVTSVAFSPDGQFLASSGFDQIINVWAFESLVDLSVLDPFQTLGEDVGSANSIAFGPDGETLASGNSEGVLRLWSVDEGSLIRTFTGHESSINAIVFTADGEFIASGSADSTVKLWLVTDGTLVRTLEGHESSVTSVAFDPDGEVLASASDDSTIKLWVVDDGSLVRTLSGHAGGVNSLAFTPSGEILVSGSEDGTIKLWFVDSGSVIHTLRGHSGSVNSIAVDAQGKHVASGSSDFTIKLWLVSSGDLLNTLTGDIGEIGIVNAVSFSRLGRHLVTGRGYPDYTVTLWSVSYQWVMVP